MTIVSSLWIGERLTPLAQASLQSFIGKGYQFNLYCYQAPENVPAGCTVLDAATILPEDRIIRYTRGPGAGSVALFANMFRYKLLHEVGGWWVDTDMFCIVPSLPDEGVVLAQEDERGLNCAIMRFPVGHEAMRVAYEACVRRGEDVEWGDTGPRLLTELSARFSLTESVFPASVFYPIHYRQFWMIFDPRRTAAMAALIANAACVHLWNNMFTRSKLDLSILPPQGSLLRNMYEWTIGVDSFEQEYVLRPDCAINELGLDIVRR